MKSIIVIPTYWRAPSAESDICKHEEDFQYDHATPLDTEGTLGRALSSLSVLETDEDFVVAVVAVPTREEIKQAVQIKVQSISAQYDYKFPLFLIGPDEVAIWRKRLAAEGYAEYDHFLSLDGYANVRNVCLMAAIITGAENLILFDDDQIYEDPQYLKKALEFIGKQREGETILGVAGYYLGPDGSYLLPAASRRWRRIWGNVASLNEAFKSIGEPPRLKKTPFVFGGNMVINRELFEKIPFDPVITRGEDIDYLINAKLLGFDFYLDNELSIKHLPPPKCAPAWYQMRRDIIRFSRERAKLLAPRHGKETRRVDVEALDPYPGRFLRDNLHDLVLEASLQMAAEYLEAGREADAAECVTNIAISKAEMNIKGDPLEEYLAYRGKWEEFASLGKKLNIWFTANIVD